MHVRRINKQRSLKCLIGVAAAGLILAGGRLEASPEVRKHLSSFARDVKKYLDSKGEKSIVIGQFVGPPQLPANPGPGLAHILGQELRRLGVELPNKAQFGLSGEFRDVTDPNTKQLAFELKVKVVDRKNEPLQVFSCGILEAPEIAYLVGATTVLPREGNAAARRKKVQEDLENPSAVVRGSQVLAGPDRPYAVEILVNKRARAAKLVEGMPFVGLERGEIYAIRLTNNTDKKAAVLVSIDGLNVFAFNEDPEPDGIPRDYRVVVEPRSTALVQGWYRKNNLSDSFLVTGYAETAAAYLQAGSGKLGTITASFHEAWKRPPDLGSMPIGSSGTGFGPKVREEYRREELVTGPVLDVVTVRYTRD